MEISPEKSGTVAFLAQDSVRCINRCGYKIFTK
jgi:hypothetical protein